MSGGERLVVIATILTGGLIGGMAFGKALGPGLAPSQRVPGQPKALGGPALEQPQAGAREWVVYLLPHSHVDIGYTDLQRNVERAHWQYIEQAIQLARKTADYPEGARFKWNVEVLWAVDGYLRQASPEKQQEFIDAVRRGWIGLDALYGNELTALCRPEELIRLMSFACRLSERCGVPIDSAMITDVPGYTWGLVPAMAQCGVRFFSIGPNPGDRIGRTLAAWGDKPFYWVSPSGDWKVLCWMAGRGYAAVVNSQSLAAGEQPLLSYLAQLEKSGYPYDMVQFRCCTSDNGPPDADLPERVREWNATHTYPKLVIATTSQMFHEFERRHGSQIPAVAGDFTPYWEDGAASSARETALNRNSAERLVQAETLWAMLNPGNYHPQEFAEAWRNVLLYDEHTWGAYNSISEPDSQFVTDQWSTKQRFALDADVQSQHLLAAALPAPRRGKVVDAVDVYNTWSWARTDLVVLPASMRLAGDVVRDTDGKTIPSQRLSTGELAFLAKDVPAFGCRRFSLKAGKAPALGKASAAGNTLRSPAFTVQVDEKTGAVVSLKSASLGKEMVDAKPGLGLNEYFYILGGDFQTPRRCGNVRISVKEAGPLVASLVVESDAPGCNSLVREVRSVDGLERVDIINTLEKQPVRDKEAVHFGFPFNVPDGVMRMDIPWAVIRPEADQIPGACKNWFTVQRWVDISNKDYGVTWATPDAPLVEVGSITADKIGSQPDPNAWLEHIQPSQTLYSWVMNNYWHTNYKAYQEGLTIFRYSVRPHGAFRAEEAARFGTEWGQPLIAVPASGQRVPKPRLSVQPKGVLVTAFKPSEDGKAWIIRLFAASGKAEKARITWSAPAPKALWLSNATEKPAKRLTGPIQIPAYGIVTLRADMRK